MAGISKKNEGRISLALRPETSKAIRQLAYLCDKSINDYIATILEGVVMKNAAALENFKNAEKNARAAVENSFVDQ